MQRTLLIASLVLNAILVVGLVWSAARSRRTAFQLMADTTTAEVRLQTHILSALESSDPSRLEAVRRTLRRNIDQGRGVAADWAAAAE